MGYWDKKSIKEAKPQETVAGSESKSEIEIPEEFVDDLKKYEQDAINHVKDSTNYLSSQIKDQQKRMQTVTSVSVGKSLCKRSSKYWRAKISNLGQRKIR